MHYFVYKNGSGHAWSEFTHEYKQLYVGYDDYWKDKNGQQLKPIKLFDEAIAQLKYRDDLAHLLVVSHVAHQGKFRLLTFEDDFLHFWEVQGSVQHNAKGSPLWNQANTLFRDTRQANRNDVPGVFRVDNAFMPVGTRTRKQTYNDQDDEQRGFRTLPVKRVLSVDRRELYTSIDTLAVYQYLNRGTCRPLWRINGPPGATLHGVPLNPPDDVYSHGKLSQEQPFAAFVRLYLNGLLKVKPNLTSMKPDYENLVLNTLNPILVETAALAIVRDLGLTPDIGVGKGKDDIDVRARAVANGGGRDLGLARKAAQRLSEIVCTTAGVTKPSPELREVTKRLADSGILDIQCKAGGSKAASSSILFFGHFTESEQEGKAVLLAKNLRAASNQLDHGSNSKAGSELSRFLGLQQMMLQGTWSN